MAADLRRPRRRHAVRRSTTAPAAPLGHTLDRLAALPLLDRALARLLDHPRAVQLAGVVAGALLIVLVLRPLLLHPPTSAAAPVDLVAPLDLADQEVIAVVAAYNQASISAAVLDRADLMAPYLAPDGTAWAEVQAEYQRRAARGEHHEPALARWGILRTAVEGDAATVETQEQWDDITSVGGQVISSRRGILTRNRYTLRRAPDGRGWLISRVTGAVVIG